MLAALVAGVVAAPIFWINREWVWNYYYIGHYVGPESAIRNPHFGLGQSVAFVWEHLAHRHLGALFGGIAIGGTALLALGGRRMDEATPRDAWVLAAIFFLAPALVLTLHRQKSEVVISALSPGAVLLVVAAWAEMLRRNLLPWIPAAFAIAVAAAAGTYFTVRRLGPTGDEAAREHIQKVAALADYVFARAQAAGMKAPRIAADYITDCLDGQVLRVVCYERHHVWVPFEMTLPTGIAEPTAAEVMARLARSDFVFLTEEAGSGSYPFDQKLTALRPQLRAWCGEHLRLVEHFQLIGRRMVLYQRREIPLK